MAEKIRSKWQVRGAVVAIFVLGFVAGMLALHSVRSLGASPSAGESL
jgi:hypothetical protein